MHAAGGMQVCVTHATSFGLDQNLTWSGCGDLPLAQHQRLAKLFDNSRFHHVCHKLLSIFYMDRSKDVDTLHNYNK
jgi:hypothetical protein